MKLAREEWEQSYQLNRTPWRETDVDVSFIIEKTGIQSGIALDLGCGTGEWAIALAENGFEVEALDFSAEALKIARSQSSRPIWVEWDLEKLSQYEVRHPGYDLILDMKVLAFIENKEAYLDTIKSKLKGSYVLTVFHLHDEKPAICVPQPEFDSLIKPRFEIADIVQHATRPGKEVATYFLQ